MKPITFIFICVVAANSAYAQGIYLPSGQNGLAIAGGYQPDELGDTFGGAVSYSFAGTFDAGANISYTVFDEDELGFDATAVGFGPAVSWHALKPNDSLPLGISLGGAYSFLSVNSDDLDDFGAEVSGNTLTFSGVVSGFFDLSDTALIRPYGGVYYANTELEVELDGFGSESESDDETGAVLGLEFLFGRSGSTWIALGPSITFARDERQFGVGIAVILPR